VASNLETSNKKHKASKNGYKDIEKRIIKWTLREKCATAISKKEYFTIKRAANHK
jgi:hypothetical protein